MKAIVFQLPDDSGQEFEIGENVDRNAPQGTRTQEYDLSDPVQVKAFWESVEGGPCDYEAFNEMAYIDARDGSNLLKSALRPEQYGRYESEIDKRPSVSMDEFDFIMTGDYRFLDEDEEQDDRRY
jgi:hypothetical protein